MYYPQDSPVELGPTHVIPGTQFNRGLTDEDRARALPLAGRAGTVSLTHFDVGHAAGVSLLPMHRHMIKFIYMRARRADGTNLGLQKHAHGRSLNSLSLPTIWNWLGRTLGTGSAASGIATLAGHRPPETCPRSSLSSIQRWTWRNG